MSSAVVGGAVAAGPGDIGFEGPSYTGVSGSHPTQEKPESKLWYHDGSWWGSFWSNPTGAFTVHRLDRIAHTWVDTGTVLEGSGIYRQDTLFDGTKLYVASHRYATSPGSADARLVRLSYDPGTRSWSVDAGFPVTLGNARSETLTIAKDTNGMLWATWTTNGEVWVNHTVCSSTCNDAAWATPSRFDTFVGVGNAAVTSSDDISSVVAFGGKVGVYWSNQLADASYFAVHVDGAAATAWSTETTLSGTDISDDHINLATDGATVFVAVKTSHDDRAMPETLLVERTPAGVWSSVVTTMGTERLTRPIVTYDRVNDRLHWFAADVAGGHVYTKDAAARSPSFVAGKGEPVLFDASGADMNDVSSTKQSVDPSTGLVVVATDNISQTYWYHDDTLGGTPVGTITTTTTTPTTTTTTTPVTTVVDPSGPTTATIVVDPGPEDGLRLDHGVTVGSMAERGGGFTVPNQT